MKIDKITIQGFRAFTGTRTIDFTNPVTVLYGNNAQGKSSTLNAIEWCLFGDKCAGLSTGIRERKDWKPQNRTRTHACRVILTCHNDQDTIIFERTPKLGNNGLIVNVGQHVIKSNAANMWVSEHIGQFMDFMAMVYQHQENIRHLALAEPRDKREIINRMLGLGEYNTLMSTIAASKYDKWSGKVQLSIDGINKRVQDRILSYGSQNDEIAKKLALNANLVSIENARQKVLALQKKLSELSGEAVVPDSTGEKEGHIEILERVQQIRRKAREYFIQSPTSVRNQAIAEELVKLEGELAAINKLKQELDLAGTKLSEFIAQNGDEASIKGKISGLTEEKKQIEARLASANSLYAAIDPLYRYMKDSGTGTGAAQCPACGSNTQDQLSYLANKLKQLTDSEVMTLSQHMNGKAKEIESATGLLNQLSTLMVPEASLRTTYAANCDRIAKELELNLQKGEDLARVIAGKLKTAKEAKLQLEDALKSLEPKIRAIEDESDAVINYCKILDNKEHIKRLSNVKDDTNYKQLSALREYAERKSLDIEAILKAVKAIRDEAGASRVNSSKESIKKCFDRIAENPGIVDLEMCLEPSHGNENFLFRDSSGDDVIPILSQGDLNALALSIFYGIGESNTTDLPFNAIIFDDPSQSMAKHHKERIAGLISDAARARQVIVSTMDSELLAMLKDNLTMSMKVIEFSGWDPSNGPEVN